MTDKPNTKPSALAMKMADAIVARQHLFHVRQRQIARIIDELGLAALLVERDGLRDKHPRILHVQGSYSQMQADYKRLVTELAALKAIVGRLPETGDGHKITPQMELFYRDSTGHVVPCRVWLKTNLAGHGAWRRHYITEAAASAAKGAE